MTRSRLADLARGLTSLVTLVALLIAPPLALAAAVGWPLPTSIPTVDALEEAARSGVSDDVVVKVLATIAWIAWLQVAAAIACELVSLLRRRPTTRLPVVPGLQPLVAKLAAAALLLAASTASRMPSAAHATPAPAPAPPPAAATFTLPAVPPPPGAPVAAAASVTVERHDSYWAIAERTLGDGFRWREIRDANVGRTMPDGHVITPSSDIVHPGWILQVPATPPANSTSATPVLVLTGAEITVEAGDGFWDIAETQVEAALGHDANDETIRPFWSALLDANRDRLADPANPNLLFTGQRLALVGPPAPPTPEATLVPVTEAPPTTDPPSTTPPDSTAPTTTPPPATAPPSTAAPTVEAAAPPLDGDGSDAPVEEVVAAGFSALLAVGAARSLARRRRQRAHLRLVADRPTSPAAADAHRQILLDADATAVDSLEAGLAHLAAALHHTNLDTTPLVVQHGGGHLDVYLDPPAPPPPGWTATDDTNTVWTHTTRDVADPAGMAAGCPAPLLVTLGQPDDGGQLYLDLEAAGLVAVTGDPAVVRDVARTMVADLALSPLAATIDIAVIGDLGGNLADLDHVRAAASWDDVADDLNAWMTQTAAALQANGWANPFIARAVDPDHDALTPLAVIALEPPPPELLARVAELDRYTAGVVIAGHDLPGATVIDCQRDRIAVPSIGLEATPQPIAQASLDEIVALLDDPDDDETEVTEPTLFDDPGTGSPAGEVPAEPEVLVRVLGEIRVDQAPTLTAKQTSVLAFVALHGTVAAERIENAVWAAPTTNARRKRLSNTASEIRAAIGRQHFPAAADGRYTTGPAVTTDAHLFDHLVRRAASETPEAAAETLRAALEVVTGPVFTYRENDRASYTWVDLENLVSTWELRIAAVAERCADLHIDLGQPSAAAEIATRALTLIPTHTGITEALMRAHAGNGDRIAVQRVFQAHTSALEQLDLDDVAKSTSDLYETLSRRSS